MSFPLFALATAFTVLSAEPPPSCTELFDGLRAKVESNYAGYMLEVAGRRDAEYQELVASLRREAGAVETEGDCRPVLQRFIAWFDDPHLFLYQSARLDSAETARRIASVPTVQRTEAEIRGDLAARREQADPIEGIWHDRGMRYGVIRDPNGYPGRFLAIVLASDTTTLVPGMVGAVFERHDDRYTAAVRWRSLAVTHPPMSLHRSGTFLRLSPVIWSKSWPLPSGEPLPPDTSDARRPTFTVVQGVPVIAIPSHQYQYRAVLDSLIDHHRALLASATYLVVDLRGNEGGGSPMSDGLLPYILGQSETDPNQVEGRPVMLSSPDQIRYAKRSFGSDTSAFVRRLVAAMEAAPGTLVPLFEDGADFPAGAEPEPIYGPRRTAILIDGGTVSASEVLVLKARRSARALVIGEPTAGALDYQSATIVSIHSDERRFYLGYPAITARPDLPEGGMRGRGIMPERPVTWSAVTDPVRTAIDMLRREHE